MKKLRDIEPVKGKIFYNNLNVYDIIFEFKTDLLGSQDTFCGGGRYNGLSKVQL